LNKNWHHPQVGFTFEFGNYEVKERGNYYKPFIPTLPLNISSEINRVSLQKEHFDCKKCNKTASKLEKVVSHYPFLERLWKFNLNIKGKDCQSSLFKKNHCYR